MYNATGGGSATGGTDVTCDLEATGDTANTCRPAARDGANFICWTDVA